jgi:hypothetical protein
MTLQNPAIEGEPTVRFEAQNALEIDLTWLTDADYTIIVAMGAIALALPTSTSPEISHCPFQHQA